MIRGGAVGGGGGGSAGPADLAGYENFAGTSVAAPFSLRYSGVAWARSNDAGFFRSGGFSRKSPPTPHSGANSMFVDFEIPTGKVGRFLAVCRVSSEPTFDTLRVMHGARFANWASPVGGTATGSAGQSGQLLSGNPSIWAYFVVEAVAGLQTVEFRYSKDGSGAQGNDAAYVDSLALFTVPA